MTHVKAFVAGFASTLIFHQPLLALLWATGLFPRMPYDLHPVAPLGLPAVVSLAFWGGVWGAALWPLLLRAEGGARWWRAFAVGAVAPTSVALLIVAPLKGAPVAAGGDPRIILGAMLLNGVWGLGVAFLMRAMRASDRPLAPARSLR